MHRSWPPLAEGPASADVSHTGHCTLASNALSRRAAGAPSPEDEYRATVRVDTGEVADPVALWWRLTDRIDSVRRRAGVQRAAGTAPARARLGQGARRRTLADLLPPLYGYVPPLRIADFEVGPCIWDRGAAPRLATLLEERLSNPPSVAPSLAWRRPALHLTPLRTWRHRDRGCIDVHS